MKNWYLEEDKNIDDIFLTLGTEEESDRYYVYALYNGDIPFYIGKGVGARVCSHQKEVYDYLSSIENPKKKEKNLEQLCHEYKNISLDDIDIDLDKIEINTIEDYEECVDLSDFEQDEFEKKLSDKYKHIIKSIAEGRFNKRIIKWGLTENEAFMVESALINVFGKDNLTNVANGHMSNKEKASHNSETKMYTIASFPSEKKMNITEINQKSMFVNINNTYLECKDIKDKDEYKKAVYDCARVAWLMSEKRKEETEYVYAVYRSQIVGKYKVKLFKHRYELTANDFPEYPKEGRKLENKYTVVLNNYEEYEDAEKYCETNNLSINDLKKVINSDGKDNQKAYENCRNRYCFEVEGDIEDCEICILEMPDYKVGEEYISKKFTFGQNSVSYNYATGQNKPFTSDDYVSRNKKNACERIKKKINKIDEEGLTKVEKELEHSIIYFIDDPNPKQNLKRICNCERINKFIDIIDIDKYKTKSNK